MKTAVSLPDELFRREEAASRRLKVSRSEFYARALLEFLKSQQANSVTERLNNIYGRRQATVDPGLHLAQINALDDDRCDEGHW